MTPTIQSQRDVTLEELLSDMESGILTAELLSSEVNNLLNDDFLTIKHETVDLDDLEISNDGSLAESEKMMAQNTDSSWDPDVLLSNAVLPEINPLLELDETLADDYQKMLNEWETQMESLQQTQDVSYVVDDGMSNFGVSRSQESIFDDLLRSSVTSATSTTTTATTASHFQSSNFAPNFSSTTDNDRKPFITSTAPVRSQSPPVTSLMAEKSGRLTLGKRSLAGIVISSGPGGHFETYEGTKTRRNPRRVKNSDGKVKATSLLRVNNTKPPDSQIDTSVPDDTFSSSVTPPVVVTINAVDTSVEMFSCSDRNAPIEFQLPELSYEDVTSSFSSSVPDKPPTNLDPETCRIPSSMHDLSFSILESCEVEIPAMTDFERQDDCEPQEIGDSTMEDLFGGHVLEASDVDNLLDQFEASADFGGDDENDVDDNDNEDDFDDLDDPETVSTILAAVHNHFVASDTSGTKKKSPRIVPSQRIKDALPKEIVERIRASSQRSRTISIIEPANRSDDSGTERNGTGTSDDRLPSPKRPKTEHSILNGSGNVLATRFQEAASNLNKSKQLRQMGIIAPATNSHQAQVTLDHDYCSSGNKGNKRHRWTNPMTTTTPATATITAGFANQQLHHHQQKPRWTSFPSAVSTTASETNRVVSSASLLSVNKVSPSPIVIATSATSSPRPVVRVVTGTTANRFHSGVSPSPIRISAPTPTPMTIQTSSQVSLLPKSATPVRSPPLRGENDPKKDSGLESGEVSDASEGVQHEVEGLYSKVPAYLTSVNVENADSRTVNSAEDSTTYDRIPAYVKGVTAMPATARIQNSVVTLGDENSKSPRSSRSRSPVSRFRDVDSSPVRRVPSRLNDSKSPSHRLRHRRSSSSSSSKSSEPRKSSSSRRRSLKKRSNRRRTRSRSRSRSFSPSPPRRSHYRSRSPRIGFSLEKQRLEQLQRQRREEKNRQVEERRVVYVGKISEGTTRADLRQRFEVFGPILEISLHFRDTGDNYGFVTFKYKKDAYEAIERGNDNPAFSKVDLCFGGRRNFCKEKYSDLDYIPPSAYDDSCSGMANDFDALLQKAKAGLKKK